MKAIDGHRHVVLLEAITAASKLDPVKSSHLYPSGLAKRSEEINRVRNKDWDRKMSDADENISDLVAAGMDMGVLQPTQTMFFYWAEPSAASELSRMVNESTAKEVRKHPDKWIGLATVPLQDVDTAVRELSYAVKELRLRGVVMGSNVNGHGFDEEVFQPFFEKAEELGVPLFIHPNNPAGIERTADYYLTNFLGYPLESTIAAAKLVFGGVLDRYPRSKDLPLPRRRCFAFSARPTGTRAIDSPGGRRALPGAVPVLSEELLRGHHHIPCRYPPFRLGPYASGTCVHGDRLSLRHGGDRSCRICKGGGAG